ncbi:hypothetical protein TNCV_1440691 [Trichonephila clavipes]|nr:hypothetical protein TNCV_1440691 [Trichonephila clavipes]
MRIHRKQLKNRIQVSSRGSSENYSLLKMHSVSSLSGIDGLKSITNDTSEWNDLLLLTLELSPVSLGLEGRFRAMGHEWATQKARRATGGLRVEYRFSRRIKGKK